MSDLFRKSSLEKLSSPEQLDRAIVITPSAFWIALVGGFVIVLVALIWAIFGRIPVNVDTQGIYLSGDGTGGVYAQAEGVVTEVRVESGQEVNEGDILAVIGGGDISSQIQKLSTRIEALQKITVKSTDDVATADNKSLLDIKDESIALTDTYNQVKASLDTKQQELDTATAKESELKSKVDTLKAKYYDVLNKTGDSSAELAYSEAQSNLSMKQSEYSTAQQTLEQTNSSLKQTQAEYDSLKSSYNDTKKSVNSLKSTYQKAKTSYQKQATKLEELLQSGASDKTIAAAQQKLQDLQTAGETAQTAYEQGKSELTAAKSSLNTAKQQVSALKDEKTTAQTKVQKTKKNLDTAESKVKAAKDKYTAELKQQADTSAKQQVAANEYSQAVSEYATQQSQVVTLESTVQSLKEEADSAQDAVQAQNEKIKSSFDSTKASLISELQTELDQQTETLQKYEVVSTQAGTVQEIVPTKGTMVSIGSEIAKVKCGNESQKEVLCYMPISDGKKVVAGMEVMVYPTTVNKQEYGHMIGTVVSVADYVTSQEEMQKRLGDTTLVEAFLANGPVIAVVCSLEEDADTVSGYAWSSKKGADVYITEGTMLEASIITEKKAPITMVIPLLKEFFNGSVTSTTQEGA